VAAWRVREASEEDTVYLLRGEKGPRRVSGEAMISVWELPVEPGPEVTVVRDCDGRLWTRADGWWIYRTGTYTAQGVEIVYRVSPKYLHLR
jgi:hypothetical protein